MRIAADVRRAGRSGKPGTVMRLVLASILTAAAVLSPASADPLLRDGPFNVLDWRDGVATSRDGHGVWVSVAGFGARVRLPGHTGLVPDGRVVLHASCRARDGDVPDIRTSHSAAAGIYLDDHPEQRDAYSVLHPMYWVLGLSGHAEERLAVQARIAGLEPVRTELVRALTDYSAPRPGLDIALPPATVLAAFETGGEIGVEVRGSGVSVDGSFVPSGNARRAAALMRAHCLRP